MKRTTLALILGTLFLAVGLDALCAPGGDSGPPPGKGPGAEEAGNNISYPAFYAQASSDIFAWSVPEDAILGVHYSYGCDLPQTIDIYSYPNTTCIGVTGFLDAQACTVEGAPCYGYTVDRIYWQKVADNNWGADSLMSLDPLIPAHYVDWGDNLESRTWSTRSVVRVETQAYVDISLIAGLEDELLRGFQMWHVEGQGPSEQWGVRAQESGTAVYPYIYTDVYALLHTNTARLNIAKLTAGVHACPSAAGGEAEVLLPELDWVENAENPGQMNWVAVLPEDESPCQLRDIAYTAELNVGGKWVYGYNWQTKRDVLDCPGFDKAGWWRLTFYTTGNEIDLSGVAGPPYGPPVLSAAVPTDPAFLAAEAESESEGPLYQPVVDVPRNITYIDICLMPKNSGKGIGKGVSGGSGGGSGNGSGGGGGGGHVGHGGQP